MAKIKFENVCLQYPIYEKGQKSRSLKHAILKMRIGGILSKGKDKDNFNNKFFK